MAMLGEQKKIIYVAEPNDITVPSEEEAPAAVEVSEHEAEKVDA